MQDSHIEILGIELPKDELEVELLSLLIEQHHGREMVVSIKSLELELKKQNLISISASYLKVDLLL